MATYYCDFVNGLDANNGLGPDASHATNKPWKTIAKLLGAAGMASGDSAYLSPAGPFREVVTVAMTSATVETKIMGDPGNAQGFKTSGGVLVSPGEVRWTAFLTNDRTAASASACCQVAGRNFLTFEDITIVAGGGNCFLDSTHGSHDITVRRCGLFAPLTDAVYSWGAAGVAANWLIENNVCCFLAVSSWGIHFVVPRHTADYDIGVTIRNNVFLLATNGATIFESTGAGTGKGGGAKIYNNSSFSGNRFLKINDANLGGTLPFLVYNNLVLGTFAGALEANNTAQVTEDFNVLLYCASPRTNVTAGGSSITTGYAPGIELGQSVLRGAAARSFGTPTAGSAFLGFGADATYGAALTTDLFGPRPAGGASALKAVGALERPNTGARETTTVRTGSNALSFTGPGYQDFLIPVAAASTTVTVYGRFDATYAGTLPKLQVLAQPEIGVGATEDTMTVAHSNWEQLSINFTPTAAGVVTVRLLSSSTAATGVCFFDDWAVT